MNNIVKFGNLVHRFVKEFDGLRDERDVAVKKIGDIEIELNEAKGTIRKLDGSKEDQAAYKDVLSMENKKREIINQIDFIIDSIDSMELDNLTDV